MQWLQTVPEALRQATTIDLRDGGAVIVLDRSGTCVGADEGSDPGLGPVVDRLLGRGAVDGRWRWYDADGRPIPDEESPLSAALSTGEPVVRSVLGLESQTAGTGAGFAWVEVAARPVRGDDGTVEGVVTTLRDRTHAPEGRAATAALARAVRTLATATAEDEQRFRLLADGVADVLFQTDVGGRCVWVSPSVVDVLGWAPEQVLGRSLVWLLHPADREVVNERRLASLAGHGGHERLELRYATSGAGWRWMSAVSRPLHDASGRVTGGLTALHDVHERVQREEEARYVPRRDALTGLVDREAGVHALGSALRDVRGTGRSVGVLAVDVDGFRAVNESRGNETGDRVLVAVARRLTSQMRDSDVVARLGGDHFLVVLTSMREAAHALARAEGLVAAVAAYRAEDLPPVTVSIGVRADDGSGDAARLLAEADAALRRAQEDGRDRASL